MAVVNLKSTQVTNQDAGIAQNPYVAGGRPVSEIDIAALTSGDSIASTYRVVRIPSNARLVRIALFNDAITTCAANIGVYQTAANGGAAVSAAILGAAVSLASAQTQGDGMPAVAAANRTKRLWELLGLAADSMRDYDIVFTLTAAAGSTGNAGLDVQYVL